MHFSMKKKALFESTKKKENTADLMYRNNLPYLKSEQKQIQILFVHEGSSLRKHVNK